MFPAKPSTASGASAASAGRRRSPRRSGRRTGSDGRSSASFPRGAAAPRPQSTNAAHGRYARAEPPEHDQQRQHERRTGAVDEALEALRRGEQQRYRAGVGADLRSPRARSGARRRRRSAATATAPAVRSRGVVLEHVSKVVVPSPPARSARLRPHSLWASKKAVASSLRDQKYALDRPPQRRPARPRRPKPRGPLPRASQRERQRDQDAVRPGERGDRADDAPAASGFPRSANAAAHAAAANAIPSG